MNATATSACITKRAPCIAKPASPLYPPRPALTRLFSAQPVPPRAAQTNALAELTRTEWPQERAERLGVGALGDSELLALLLRSGTRGRDVLSLARQLLTEAGSLALLVRWREADFRRIHGIGKVKALQLCTVMEIARRVLSQPGDDAPPRFDTGADIYRHMRPRALGLAVEKAWVLSLDARHRLLRCEELTSGTVSRTLMDVRAVLAVPLRDQAASFVLAHNHPSGNPEPSPADLILTRKLRAAAETMELPFADHVILGDPARDPQGQGYVSLRAMGML
jgi:DNA repair protein RadC